MNTFSTYENTEDPALVARVLSGNRDCFGALVLRHQSAVCGVAYAVCGDFKMSEDIAQDAFVAAWNQLRELRETSHFRAWVCGISRQLALTQVRRRERRGDHISSDFSPEAISEEPDPGELAVTQEESDLLWKSLDCIPETYREPLVLFYREQESIASVASSLELSEDAVRQRLSRGRALLREEVAKRLERVLGRTRPGVAFTAGVLGALPPVLAASGLVATTATAKAATASGAGISTGTGWATVAFAWAVSGMSALLGLLWVYLSYRMLNAPWMPAGYRRELKRLALRSAGVSLVLAGFITWVAWTRGATLLHWGLSVGPVLAGVILLCTAANFLLTSRAVRTLVELRREHMKRPGIAHGSAELFPACSRRYASAARFAGLPFVSVAFGADAATGETHGVAKGWIAIGDTAWGGLFALGGKAVAPIAVGGVAAGLLSMGGASLGVITCGGVGLGWLATGGLAIAWNLAAGGVALAGTGAVGGLAAAGAWAIAGVGFADHVNDGVALGLFRADSAMQLFIRLAPYAGLLSLLGVPSLIVGMRQFRRASDAWKSKQGR